MVDRAVTQAILASELPDLARRAERAGWNAARDDERLTITIRITHKATGLPFILVGSLEGYKAVPPAWEFIDPDTGQAGTTAAYPQPPNPTPGGGSGVFITYNGRRVICLPCNRLAYDVHGGPHSGDWVLANWTRLNPQFLTLCEMVNRINTELQASPGPAGPRRQIPS